MLAAYFILTHLFQMWLKSKSTFERLLVGADCGLVKNGQHIVNDPVVSVQLIYREGIRADYRHQPNLSVQLLVIDEGRVYVSHLVPQGFLVIRISLLSRQLKNKIKK